MSDAKTRPLSEVGGPPYNDGYWSRYEGHSRTPPEGAAAAPWLEGWDECDSEIRLETEDDRSRPASREMALDAGDPDLEGWPT